MGESEVISAAKLVAELVVGEIRYLGGVRDKVKILSSELSGVANFLTDSTSGSRPRNETLKGIISEARDVAYDCEDAIETYALVVQHRYDDNEGCLGSLLRYACLLPKALPAHRIGKKIDGINTRISALQNKIKSYLPAAPNPIEGDRSPNTDRVLERVNSFGKPEFEVVGFDEYSADLLNSLNDPNDKRVILIWGMGGIGKSTLAKEIYQKPPPGRFKATGWAQATRQFDSDKVVRTLLYSLVPVYSPGRKKIEEEIGANRAFAALKNQMNTESCLVIIDDIWDPRDWANIADALRIDAASGSRIILTSRNNNILPADWSDTQKLMLNVMPLDKKKQLGSL